MYFVEYIKRLLWDPLAHHLQRGKSILLLGPRQTGKTTMVAQQKSDLEISFVVPHVRQRYERDLSLLAREIAHLGTHIGRRPLVILDEIQKVPEILDVVQAAIDANQAQFILTGSSARKLRRGSVNLLPGRVVTLRLDPFVCGEHGRTDLNRLLFYGALPGIHGVDDPDDCEADLRSYVETYLEEEVRSEAIVRSIGHFARFLEYAGLESGKIVSFRALSQEIGVSHTTIISYFEILEDCLIAERIDPLTKSATRKRLTKSSRYMLFDLGVRRLCANEGTRVTPQRKGELFEQFVGLELIRLARLHGGDTRVTFWRDANGPEVDWVLQRGNELIPIEVKLSATPAISDAKHVALFLKEYGAKHGYVVCRTERPFTMTENVTALPWQAIETLLPVR